MKLGLTRKRVIWGLAAVVLALGCFAFGFVACLHLKSAATSQEMEQRLTQPGNAPQAARAGVLASLQMFQDGYVRRDTKGLDAFMRSVFPKDGDFLVLGTEGGADEWTRGYADVAGLVRADWQNWGDFRFDVNRSIVWSQGDVAWIATNGEVRFKDGARPLRLTAVLTQEDGRWVFRQVHFQWDDADPDAHDILLPATYLRLGRMMARRVGHRGDTANQ